MYLNSALILGTTISALVGRVSVSSRGGDGSDKYAAVEFAEILDIELCNKLSDGSKGGVSMPTELMMT